MIRPSLLRWIHDQYDLEQSLPDVLGDGFLLYHCRFYRRLRELSLTGGQFFCSFDDLTRIENPELNQFRNGTHIHYVRTTSLLDALTPLLNDEKLEERELITYLPRNQIFRATGCRIGLQQAQVFLRSRGQAEHALIMQLLARVWTEIIITASTSEIRTPLHFIFKQIDAVSPPSIGTCQLVSDLVEHFGYDKLLRIGACIRGHYELDLGRMSDRDIARISEIACGYRQLSIIERRILSETAVKLWMTDSGTGTSASTLQRLRVETKKVFEHFNIAIADLMFQWADWTWECFKIQ